MGKLYQKRKGGVKEESPLALCAQFCDNSSMTHGLARFLVALALALSALPVRATPAPAWAERLPIYQAYPHDGWGKGYAEGSYLRRTEALLPALKDMGVGVVWLLPLHPRGPAPGTLPPPLIGKTAQFQSLSPYCVRDYYAVDPHWGSQADLKRLVRRAHTLKMRVLMDMVINHTSWGNPLITQRPEFYAKDEGGRIRQVGGWADIAQLDYTNHAVWDYMRDMLVFWVRDAGVDGFRMDAADRVPPAFWTWLRPQLNAVRPVLLLAEDEQASDFPAFDLAYEWRLAPLLWGLAGQAVDGRDAAAGTGGLDALRAKLARDFPPEAVLMNHLDNHDLHPQANPWAWGHGPAQNTISAPTVLARYGAGYRAFSVLAATLPGRPMLYNSQEMWTPGDAAPPPIPDTPAKLRSAPNFDFYRRLLTAYQGHPALYAGTWEKIPSDKDAAVYAFARVRGADRVVVVLNLSGTAQAASLRSPALPGAYRELFTGERVRFGEAAALTLGPWAYRVYERAGRPPGPQ